MANYKRILVALDQSRVSAAEVQYVADVVDGNPAFHVGLLHLEPPPRMLEWGGAEDEKTERKVSAERAKAYEGLEEEVIEEGQAFLQRYQGVLEQKGIQVTAHLVQFEEPMNAKTVTQHILKTAQDRDYGTVVVGRHSFSGLQSLFHHHVGEELVRVGEGIVVWVVE